MNSIIQRKLFSIYDRLYASFGPQYWWPGQTPFEVMVGAILTQNTNWSNVEKAISNLKHARVLTPRAMHMTPVRKLATLIKPSGYFNVKAGRLKNFVNFLLDSYGGSIKRMRRESLQVLREQILAVNGIGPETADSILLYALDKSTFVIDAYTKRIFSRHGMVDLKTDYAQVQKIFTSNLPRDKKFFNEYHALIVKLGKEFCRPKPRCKVCPLRSLRHAI